MADFNFYEPNYLTQIAGTAQEGALENVFDGDLNTFAIANGEGANGITFSPVSWTTANSVTSLRIYCTRYARTNDTSGKLWVNGVDYTAGVNGSIRAWTTISETDIQTIRWDKTGADGSDGAQNSYVLVCAIEVNDSVLVNLPQLTGGVVSGFDINQLIGNTNTSFINPTYSGTSRASSTAGNPRNFSIQDIDAGATGDHSAKGGFLRGRRPHRKLLFPRGYYNK